MQQLIFDTTTMKAADRFDWWANEMEEKIGIACGRLEDAPYWGRLHLRSLSCLTHLDFRAQNNLAQRLRPQIRHLEWGQYFIYREMSDGARFVLNGREFVTQYGDLLIYDADASFQARSENSWRHHMWAVPKGMVDPHLPYLPRPLIMRIPSAGNAAPLAVAYIDALAGAFGELTEPDAASIADNLGRLLAIVCGGAQRDHGEALRSAKLAQAKQYLEQRLASPGLTPGRAATDLGLSLRQLHALFESGGESFTQYLRRRRLEACRAALASPSSNHQSITDIAFASGFASLPSFYRAFSAQLGMAPSDVRAGASRGLRAS
ncbi:Transcriptional activator NphR [Alphaproteobacteria bacterium SO-S41]|nr:Transcriptional activator NphR [Alphaproteobacteria bacterium SO-S41]